MQKMKSVIYRAIGVLSVICVLAFAAVGITISIINQNQILFEVWDGNPWPGSEPNGIYMDAEGNIFSFRVKKEGLNQFITDINKPPYFAFDLYRQYAFSGQKVGTVDKKTLDEMLRLIQPASAGVQLEFQKTGCHDFGMVSFSAFSYNEETHLHTPIILYAAGDYSNKNTTNESTILVNWLRKTAEKYNYNYDHIINSCGQDE